MSLGEVSDVLRRERDLLDLLVFKLEEQQMLLDAGRKRWMANASREVEIVRDEIRRVELLRSVAVEALAAALEIGSGLSLRQLVAALDEPWRSIFVDHRDALLVLAREIRALAELCGALPREGAGSARETIGWLEGIGTPADGGGPVLGPEEAPAAVCRAARATRETPLHPSLVEFLG